MEIKESKYIAYLEPGEGNPRNSEGSFLKLDDGRIAFAYSRFVGNEGNDHAACEIACIYSYDNGETFDMENVETLVRASEYGQKNVMSVTLRRMKNGDIGLFHGVKIIDNGFTTKYVLRRYKGDFSNYLGEVTVAPKRYTGYYVFNNDRVEQLPSGRWIVQGALHQSYQHPTDEGKLNEEINGAATVYTFLSDDDGFTWTQQNQFLAMNTPYTRTGLQEPGVVAVNGGVVYSYARTDRSYHYEAFSFDGGGTWTTPQPSKFAGPCSPLLIKKNPFSGKYYAIWNPVPANFYQPDIYGGRCPFVIAESTNGFNFSAPVILEDDPTHGYCYPAIHFLSEDELLLAYCSGESRSYLNRITIRKIKIG